MEDYKTLTVEGFDISGEPEIKIFKDKHIEILFNFMPPLNGNDEQIEDPLFDDFEEIIAKALGTEVIRDDRELFLIQTPKRGTAQKAKRFLEAFWQTYKK
jgi:hypothetical protein